MIKKIITYLLCFTLGWATVFPVAMAEEISAMDMTEEQIRAQYPDARIIHIEPEDYPQLAENLRQQGYEKKSEAGTTEAVEKKSELPVLNEEASKVDDCGNKSSLGESVGDDTIGETIDITANIFKSKGKSGSKEEAVVVFVIIGAVVIVVWALYVMKYIYDLAAGFKPCETWYDFSFTSSSISADNNQFVDFNGLHFATGFRDGNTDVGIAAEIGDSDIFLTETSSLKLEGLYWFLGPVLRWRLSDDRNPHYFHMSFMGGSTKHDEVGILAKATLGLRFGIGKNFHIGFSWGAMNINLNDNQGVITELDQYHQLFGITSGFRF